MKPSVYHLNCKFQSFLQLNAFFFLISTTRKYCASDSIKFGIIDRSHYKVTSKFYRDGTRVKLEVSLKKLKKEFCGKTKFCSVMALLRTTFTFYLAVKSALKK